MTLGNPPGSDSVKYDAVIEVLMRHAGRAVSPHELCAAIDQRHNRDDHVAR